MTAARPPIPFCWLALVLVCLPLLGWTQTTLRVVVAEQRAPRCSDLADGRIVLRASGGLPPYLYQVASSDQLLTSEVFENLADGLHTFWVYDALGQSAYVSARLQAPQPIVPELSIRGPGSCLAGSGSLNIARIVGGLPPYRFTINGQPPTTSNQFDGLYAGSYVLGVADANACQVWVPFTIPAAETLSVRIESIRYPSRCDQADGQIVLSLPAGGTPPYRFRRDEGDWQTESIFDGLPVGLHRFQVWDAQGCAWEQILSLERERPFVGLDVIRPLSGCSDTATADLRLNVLSGQGLAGWRLADSDWQTSTTIHRLAPGTYRFQFVDTAGCTSSMPYTLQPRLRFAAWAQVLQRPHCPDNATGHIRVQVRPLGQDHAPPYRFSRDALTWQDSPELDGFSAGLHEFWVQDGMGCMRRFAVELPPHDPLGLYVELSNDPMTCGDERAALRWRIEGGQPPYEYSLDGRTWLPEAGPDSVTRGTYVGYVRDARGCITHSAHHRVQPFLELQARVLNYPICSDRRPVGVIHLSTNFGSQGLRFSIDGGVSYSPDSVYRNLPPDRYRLLVYDPIRQCGDSLTLDLSQLPVFRPAIEIIRGDCRGLTASVGIQLNPDSLQLLLRLSPQPLFSRGSKMIRNNLQPGRYWLQVFDPVNQCPLLLLDESQQPGDSIRIEVEAPMQYQLQSHSPSACNASDGRIELLDPLPGYRLALENRPPTGAALDNLTQGSYRVRIENESGCLAYEQVDLHTRPFQVQDSIRPASRPERTDGWARLNFRGNYELPFRIFFQEDTTFVTESFVEFGELSAGPYFGWAEDARGCRVVFRFEIAAPRPFTLGGRVFEDWNRNGRFDAGERPLVNQWVRIQNVNNPERSSSLAVTDAEGVYRLPVNERGLHRVQSLAPPNFERIAPDSSGYLVQADNLFNLPDNLDIALLAPPAPNDWGVLLTQRNPAQPGQVVEYVASLKWSGTEPGLAHLLLEFDNRLQFNSLSNGRLRRQLPAGLELEAITLNEPSAYDPVNNLAFRFELPNEPAWLGSLLEARLFLRDADDNPGNNESRERRRIIEEASINRKIVRTNSLVAADTVFESESLDYIIYFQNTGQHTVQSLLVEDVLSPHLDWTTLETVSASHPYRITWGEPVPMPDGPGKRLFWLFEGIDLPDSITDPVKSVGFVRFRIRPRRGTACNTLIENTAWLRFDDQPPIRTPAARTRVNPLPRAVVFAQLDTLFVGETNRMLLVNQRHVHRVGIWDLDTHANSSGTTGSGPIEASWSSPGLKRVRVPIHNAFCSSVAETQIQVNWRCPSANLSLWAPDTVYNSVPFQLRIAGRPVPHMTLTLWPEPDLEGPVQLPVNEDATVRILRTGTFLLQIQVIENENCRYSLDQSIDVLECPSPIKLELETRPICIGEEAIRIQARDWGPTYLFVPALEAEFLFLPDDELKHQVEAHGEAYQTLQFELIDTATHCRHYVSTTVHLRACPTRMPDTFTPNGDGINDRWGPDPNLWQSIRIRVFDRVGRQVFASQSVTEHWDGTFQGRSAPEGAYHYMAEGQLRSGQWIRLSGRITLLR